LSRQPFLTCSLFGLAPRGVYPAALVTKCAVALLPQHFTHHPLDFGFRILDFGLETFELLKSKIQNPKSKIGLAVLFSVALVVIRCECPDVIRLARLMVFGLSSLENSTAIARLAYLQGEIDNSKSV
jgi:hypothetical protein